MRIKCVRSLNRPVTVRGAEQMISAGLILRQLCWKRVSWNLQRSTLDGSRRLKSRFCGTWLFKRRGYQHGGLKTTTTTAAATTINIKDRRWPSQLKIHVIEVSSSQIHLILMYVCVYISSDTHQKEGRRKCQRSFESFAHPN
jgi:hypothetical protein